MIMKTSFDKFSTNKYIKDEARLRFFKEILYNSTGQAIVKIIYSQSYILKIFWISCLMGACSLCAYFVIESLVIYFTPVSSTLVRTHFETMSLFPKITICNKNAFTTKYAYDLANGTTFDEFTQRVNMQLNDTQRELLQHSLDDILLDCQFNTVNCTSREFIREYDKLLGSCFIFNSGLNATRHSVPLKESLRAGSSYGLRLSIYINFYDKLINAYCAYYGLIIKIGNSSYASLDYGHELAPGFKTNILVDRFFEKQMPKPYTNCDIDNDDSFSHPSELYKLIWHSPIDYTQQLCFEVCQMKMFLRECNCILSDKYSLLPNNISICNKNLECAKNLTSMFQSNIFLQASCLNLCPLQCNRTVYRVSMSSSMLIGDTYIEKIGKKSKLKEDFVNRPLNEETAKNSVVRVHVFYETLSYTESIEIVSKPSMLSLAANIGGIMSLFMGVNVLSVFEVLEIFIELYVLGKSQF